MAHGDAREGKWSWNWRMEWVASTLHTTSEHGVSSITTTDAHTSAASIRLTWRPRRFKWTRPFRCKTKSGSCSCAITFQLDSTTEFRFRMTCLLHVVLYGIQERELGTWLMLAKEVTTIGKHAVGVTDSHTPLQNCPFVEFVAVGYSALMPCRITNLED